MISSTLWSSSLGCSVKRIVKKSKKDGVVPPLSSSSPLPTLEMIHEELQSYLNKNPEYLNDIETMKKI